MALSDQTAQIETTDTPAKPEFSGATHQTSGPSGPDPTGLRGSLEKNFAAAAEKATQQHNATKKPEVSRETPAEKPAERGPDGKFAAKAPPPAEVASQAPADEPPSSWRAETKALWKEIDAKFGPEQGKLLKEELRKREGDYIKGLKAKDEEVTRFKSFHDQVNPVLEPVMAQWQQQGVSPAQALQHLIGLQTQFQRDPAGTIRWLANTAKIDLSTLVGAAQASGDTPEGQIPPQLQQVIHGLQSKLQALETGWESQNMAARTAEIQAFMDEKGQDGQPLRPFINDVMQDLQAELQIIRQTQPNLSVRETMSKAYEAAIWRNPETRQRMMDAATGQKREAEAAEQRQRAAEAATKNVRGGPPNHLNGVPAATNLRGLLEARYNATYGGGNRL